MATRRSAFSPFLQSLSDILVFFGQLATLFLEGCWFVVRGKISVRATLRQMGEVGVGSLFVAIVTVGFSGAVLALYTSIQLVKFGQAGLAGGVIGKSLALEIAPVITAIVVSARSGSAMAAELGSMAVTEQVDALKTMAVSPVQYLVVPRILGTMIMMPIVMVLANLAGLYAASLTASLGGISPTLFWRSFQDFVTVGDQLQGIFKTIPFGILIALIGCRQGLTTRNGAQGVGRATTSAVVFGSMAIYMVDFFISLIIQDFTSLRK
ncbi:MAG TPA: ABC transporter permease [Abditibacterium sp.]|jgi:phospholipid/cholesterol/gamma-HCH transport system permease protein